MSADHSLIPASGPVNAALKEALDHFAVLVNAGDDITHALSTSLVQFRDALPLVRDNHDLATLLWVIVVNSSAEISTERAGGVS